MRARRFAAAISATSLALAVASYAEEKSDAEAKSEAKDSQQKDFTVAEASQKQNFKSYLEVAPESQSKAEGDSQEKIISENQVGAQASPNPIIAYTLPRHIIGPTPKHIVGPMPKQITSPTPKRIAEYTPKRIYVPAPTCECVTKGAATQEETGTGKESTSDMDS